jgi:hypothetical protein
MDAEMTDLTPLARKKWSLWRGTGDDARVAIAALDQVSGK